jgi:SRSO17 transposase
VEARGAGALLDRLGHFLDRFTDCFSRRVQRTAASQYLQGLFNDSERKSMQAMHGRLSQPIHYQALQHFVTHSPWPDQPLWDRLNEVIPERRGILAIDDTGLPKQGKRSVGVKRQYSGTLGKTGNCQVAVSSLLIGTSLVWPMRCELYLPRDWTDDTARRATVDLPPRVRFREKWRIALGQVRATINQGIEVTTVVTDADYGSVSGFRHGLERLGLRYAVAIRSNLTVGTPGARRVRTVADIGKRIPARQWRRVCWGQGTKGPLAARFGAVRVRPARSRGERWVLCERSLAKDERKYYLLNLDASASLKALVTLARCRWPIEQQYRELKDELGWDHFEGRTFRGWNHHSVLTAIGFTFLQLERRRSRDERPPTLPQIRFWVREIMAMLYIASRRDLLNLAISFQRDPPLRI